MWGVISSSHMCKLCANRRNVGLQELTNNVYLDEIPLFEYSV